MLSWLVNDAIPTYLKSVPVPNSINDVKFMTLMEWAHLTVFMGTAGYIGYAVAQVKVTVYITDIISGNSK